VLASSGGDVQPGTIRKSDRGRAESAMGGHTTLMFMRQAFRKPDPVAYNHQVDIHPDMVKEYIPHNTSNQINRQIKLIRQLTGIM
jgi:hypothetical protein